MESEFSAQLVHNIPATTTEADQIWIEAEDGILYRPMEENWNAGASSGGYIWVPKGNGNLYSLSGENGSAEYTFEVPRAGTYFLWGRVISNTFAEDSFFISIDGKAFFEWHTQLSDVETWIWDQLRDGPVSDGAIVYLDLEAGQHTLTIKQREDGTKIDKIMFSNDLEYVPEGVGGGPNETGSEPDNPGENPDAPVENLEPAGPVMLWLEAESGKMNYPFEPAYDSKASSGQFAWVPNGRGNSWDPNQSQDYMEYHFEVPAGGDYTVWGRVRSRSGGDNSFFVSVDNGAYALWDTKRSKSWKWDAVSSRKGSDPVIYHLGAGAHTLTIKLREILQGFSYLLEHLVFILHLLS